MGLAEKIFTCLLICSIIVAIILVSTGLNEDDISNKEGIKLKFSDFKKYYYLNPENYDLCYYSDYAYYSGYIDKYKSVRTRIYFNWFDNIRFKGFRKKIKAEKIKEKDNERLQRYLNAVQCDINKAREEYNKSLEEAQRILVQNNHKN